MSDAYGGPCDRGCLEAFVERCLEALVAGDAGRLPASPDLRYTENGRPLPLGRGLWRTVRAREFAGTASPTPRPGRSSGGGSCESWPGRPCSPCG